MWKTLLATVPAFALAGALATSGGAVAHEIDTYTYAPPAGYVAAEGDVARYDAEKNCWVLDRAIMGDADNPEPNEPQPRFDAARECVAFGTAPPAAIAENPEILNDPSDFPSTGQ